MLKRSLTVVAIALLAAGCEADEEAFEEGAGFDAPDQVEEAPATPIPPQQMETPEVVPVDTLQEVEVDTAA